jgi:hypothetical protein
MLEKAKVSEQTVNAQLVEDSDDYSEFLRKREEALVAKQIATQIEKKERARKSRYERIQEKKRNNRNDAAEELVMIVSNFAHDFSVLCSEDAFRKDSECDYDRFFKNNALDSDFIKEFCNEVLSTAMKYELISKYRYLQVNC